MKNIYLLFIGMLLVIELQAQNIMTIENKAGKLDSLLTQEELNSITNLTITGTMDARDFKTLRDEMALLSELDISAVTILGFFDMWGGQGTFEETIFYDENTIPWNSFSKGREIP